VGNVLEPEPISDDEIRHRLIRLAGVGHTAADVLAAERTREIVFAGRRGQPRA